MLYGLEKADGLQMRIVPDLAGVALPLPIGPRRLSIVVAGPTSRCLERRPQTAAIMAAVIADALPQSQLAATSEGASED